MCLWWLLLARCAVLVGCRADSLLLHRVSSKADRLARMDSLFCLKGPTYLLALRLCFSLPRPYFLFQCTFSFLFCGRSCDVYLPVVERFVNFVSFPSSLSAQGTETLAAVLTQCPIDSWVLGSLERVSVCVQL